MGEEMDSVDNLPTKQVHASSRLHTETITLQIIFYQNII